MALIACPECGRQVSTSASSCPGCGHPLQQAANLQEPGLLGKLTALLGVWLLAPWVARLLAFVAACALAIVVVLSRRS